MNDEVIALLKEQIKLQKENNELLKQLFAFWSNIVSDEYFNEMLENKLPK